MFALKRSLPSLRLARVNVDRLGVITEGGKTLGVRSLYSGDPDVICPA
jgi:hypothetical protein